MARRRTPPEGPHCGADVFNDERVHHASAPKLRRSWLLRLLDEDRPPQLHAYGSTGGGGLTRDGKRAVPLQKDASETPQLAKVCRYRGVPPPAVADDHAADDGGPRLGVPNQSINPPTSPPVASRSCSQSGIAPDSGQHRRSRWPRPRLRRSGSVCLLGTIRSAQGLLARSH